LINGEKDSDISKESSNTSDTSANLSEIMDATGSLMGAILSNGVNSFIVEIGKQIEKIYNNNLSLEIQHRKWSLWLLGRFIAKSQSDYSEYLTIMLKHLLSHAADTDIGILNVIIESFSSLNSALNLDLLMGNIDFIYNCLSSTASDAKHRALNKVLQIFYYLFIFSL
jgi:hypothetical protein